MSIHADVVVATTQPLVPDTAPAEPVELTETPEPDIGADDSTDLVPSTTTPRSGKKEKKL